MTHIQGQHLKACGNGQASSITMRQDFSSTPLSASVICTTLLLWSASNIFITLFICYGWDPRGQPTYAVLPRSRFSTCSDDNHHCGELSLLSISGGLALDKPVVYRHQTPYWGENETLQDELWDQIDTSPIVVALTDDYARTHGLEIADRWVWDDRKGRYFIKMFHSLHCLKYIRRNFIDLLRHNVSTLNPRHTQHCLDVLRKDILCYGDDTPMPMNRNGKHGGIGDGQTLMCRDYDELVNWAYKPEHHACHNSLDEYRRVTHSVERYGFCRKDSPDYQTMKAYFRDHGHVDPYEPRSDLMHEAIDL